MTGFVQAVVALLVVSAVQTNATGIGNISCPPGLRIGDSFIGTGSGAGSVVAERRENAQLYVSTIERPRGRSVRVPLRTNAASRQALEVDLAFDANRLLRRTSATSG